jgi:hypothetical protein
MSQDFKGGVFLAPMVRSGACTSPNVTVLYILPEILPRSTYPFVRFKARRRLSLGPGNGRQSNFERRTSC